MSCLPAISICPSPKLLPGHEVLNHPLVLVLVCRVMTLPRLMAAASQPSEIILLNGIIMSLP